MNLIKRYWRIIFPIFFMILIWHFSSQVAADSDSVSLRWASILGLPNGATRKLAHMALFAGLAFSFTYFIKNLHTLEFPGKKAVIYPIIFCFAYGAIDEVHQIFTPGRSSEITDILIDTVGGIFGTLLFIAIYCFFKLFKSKQKSK